VDLQNLKQAKRNYRIFLHDNKIKHFKEAIMTAKGNSRQLFSITMGLMGKKKKTSLPESGCDKDLADEFANHFMSKVQNIRNSLLNCSRYQPSDDTNSRLLKFGEVTEEVVSKILMSSKPTTCATDPIPSSLIKDNADIMVPWITQIVNKSIEEGVFPDQWKLATVTPLLKKEGLDFIMSNYRPVSNLSFISKMAEKCVIKQLNQYLADNDLNSDHQSAYKESFSTETTLYYVPL
jgi:hypothetical protein